MTKRGAWPHQSWSERFEYFSSFLKYIFRHKLGSFCCFSLQIFTMYCLWVIIRFHFQSRSKQKLSQKLKICVKWAILKVRTEKETYFWDFCRSLFQLNCLFAEINVQRLLIKENFKSQKDLFGCHIVFLLSRKRGHVPALLTLKAKWFATLI